MAQIVNNEHRNNLVQFEKNVVSLSLCMMNLAFRAIEIDGNLCITDGDIFQKFTYFYLLKNKHF